MNRAERTETIPTIIRMFADRTLDRTMSNNRSVLTKNCSDEANVHYVGNMHEDSAHGSATIRLRYDSVCRKKLITTRL